MSGQGLAPVLTVGDAIALRLDIGMADDRTTRDAIAAGALRQATGRHDIEMRRRSSGRPRLAPPYLELGVSLARRPGILLVGMSPSRAVGVDLEIEDATTGLDPVRLSADHFAPGEAARIAAIDALAARYLFLRLWVAKEALLKTIGRGIYDGMTEPDLTTALDVLAAPAGPPVTLDLPTGDSIVVRTDRDERGARLHMALARAADAGR
jgi:4'-phosphopantetheinyl transferase